MPVIIKKIIIALLLVGLTNQKKRDFARESAVQAAAHSTDYPAIINPTPAAMITLCDAGDAISSAKDTMTNDLKTLTESEAANLILILNGLSIWQLIVQGMTGLTVGKVTQLGWFVKAEGSDNRVDMMNSNPYVSGANQGTSKKIDLGLLNSMTNKKGKPYGAKGWIPYTQIGGTKPTAHDAMTAEIPTGKMKYSKTFAAADLGKQFYVTFVWYDGTENIGPDSPIYSFTII
jgi:hypothetical protein